MSQVSIIDIEGNHPQIPTQFDANVGFAIPIANVLEILGDVVAAGSTPVQTVGSGNTITTQVQISQAIAATDATKIGLSAFDSSAFGVDVNGYVTLLGGGGATTNIDVDTFTAPGTDPVVPNMGNITMTGAQVTSGTVGANVLRSASLAANTVTYQIQQSGSAAAQDTTLNGVSHFNSAHFTVANGFVSLSGAGQAIDSIGTQTGTNPIGPTAAGLVTINGAVVAAGTNPVRSNGTGANTMALEVQIAQAIAVTDATKIGLSNFNSAHFSVDANGFVSLTGGGQAIDSFSTDISGPVSPNGSGNVAFTGATNVFSDGSVANTMRLNLQGTNHALFVGRGTNTASANLGVGTNGQALLGSTGADPAFATIATNANMNTVTGAASLTLNPYNCAKWIVDSTANIGTHTTIAAAITAASSGETIFVRPGTYTENLTLKAGVTITAFGGDQDSPTVTIVGKCSYSSVGTTTIANIRLQTNSDFCLAVTGSSASIVYLENCYFNCTNNTGISFTSSSSSSALQIYNCKGNLGTTGIAWFAHGGAGKLVFRNNFIFNTGNSVTANTLSGSGTIDCYSGEFNNPFTFSSTANGAFFGSSIYMVSNTTGLTVGSGTIVNYYTGLIRSGTASAISVDGTCGCYGATLESTNASIVTGGGTFNYNAINQNVGTGVIAVTTTSPRRFWSGNYFGIQTNTAPVAGSIGENISASTSFGSGHITLATTVAQNVTSINLTAGVWDISAIGAWINGGALVGTKYDMSISATSATVDTTTGKLIETPTTPTAAAANIVSISPFRLLLSGATTYYLVASATFSAGTLQAYGRISATRVA